MKLNQKGFAHWIVPILVIVAIGGIGTVLLMKSHADALSAQSICGGTFGDKTLNRRTKETNYGTLHLLYNNDFTRGCGVFTVSGSDDGVARPTYVEFVNGSTQKDSGDFKQYAGPVYSPLSCHLTLEGGRKVGGKWYTTQLVVPCQ